MGGGGDGGKVLGHVGRTTSHNHGGAGGGHRPHSSRHGGHHASASQGGGGGGGGSTSADHAGPPDHQGGSHTSKAVGGGGSRNTAAAGGGGGGGGGGAGGAGAAWRGDLAGKSKSSKAIAAPALPSLAKPGGSGTRAPQTQSLDALGGGGVGGEGGGGVLGAVCMLMVRLLSCGRRGAKLAPMDVTLDEETEELVELLQVSKAQLAKLRGIFESIDVGKTGTVFCYEVLSAVDMAQSPFTDNLFRLVGVHPDGSLSFCQLCRILMTYCVFSKEDILLFLFRQYDTDDSGAIDEREFRELAKTVNNASPMFPGNFAKALLDFDTNSDGQIDFEEFRAMDKAFPLLFFPAFRLQDSLQKFFLGSTFWVKAQEGVLARQGVAEYQATHGGRAPDKRGRQGR